MLIFYVICTEIGIFRIFYVCMHCTTQIPVPILCGFILKYCILNVFHFRSISGMLRQRKRKYVNCCLKKICNDYSTYNSIKCISYFLETNIANVVIKYNNYVRNGGSEIDKYL